MQGHTVAMASCQLDGATPSFRWCGPDWHPSVARRKCRNDLVDHFQDLNPNTQSVRRVLLATGSEVQGAIETPTCPLMGQV